jgi:polyribonucleotide nucleotidyltransferase
MATTQSGARQQKKDNHPVTENIDVPIVKKAKFLGFGGRNLKKITAETGRNILVQYLFVMLPRIGCFTWRKRHFLTVT